MEPYQIALVSSENESTILVELPLKLLLKLSDCLLVLPRLGIDEDADAQALGQTRQRGEAPEERL